MYIHIVFYLEAQKHCNIRNNYSIFLKLHYVLSLVKNYPKSIIEQLHDNSVFKIFTSLQRFTTASL